MTIDQRHCRCIEVRSTAQETRHKFLGRLTASNCCSMSAQRGILVKKYAWERRDVAMWNLCRIIIKDVDYDFEDCTA